MKYLSSVTAALALSACVSQHDIYVRHQVEIDQAAMASARSFWASRQNDLQIFYDHEKTECSYQPGPGPEWHGRNRRAECYERLGTLQDFTNAKLAEYANGMGTAIRRGEADGLAQAAAHDADCRESAYAASGWPFLRRSGRYAHAYYSGCMSVP